MSYLRPIDSKATFATIAPEKTESKPVVPLAPVPQPEDKTVAKVEVKALTKIDFDKRDFHWHHPVYTREEYESIQVQGVLSFALTSDRSSRSKFVQRIRRARSSQAPPHGF